MLRAFRKAAMEALLARSSAGRGIYWRKILRFCFRMTFWMGIGLAALSINGKLRLPAHAGLGQEHVGSSAAGSQFVGAMATSYCRGNSRRCIGDAAALDALITTIAIKAALGSSPEAAAQRR